MRITKALLLILLLSGFSASCSNSDTPNTSSDTQTTTLDTQSADLVTSHIQDYYKRAGEQYQAGNYKESIELYTKVIESNPNMALAYNNRAAAEVSLRRYDDALADYNKAIELMPENEGAFFGRGLTKILMFEEEAGCKDLEKAGELGHPDAQSTIQQYCKNSSPVSN